MGQALACLWEGGGREGFHSSPRLLARCQDSDQQSQGVATSLNPLAEQPVPQTMGQCGDIDLHVGWCLSISMRTLISYLEPLGSDKFLNSDFLNFYKGIMLHKSYIMNTPGGVWGSIPYSNTLILSAAKCMEMTLSRINKDYK